jgi:hypothetical protein
LRIRHLEEESELDDNGKKEIGKSDLFLELTDETHP